MKRDFYLHMACIEQWSVRTLREKLGSMLFERTAISKRPEDVIKYELEKFAQTQQLTPDHGIFLLNLDTRLAVNHPILKEAA